MHTVSYKLLNQRPKAIKTGSCPKSIDDRGAMILPCKMLLFVHLAGREIGLISMDLPSGIDLS